MKLVRTTKKISGNQIFFEKGYLIMKKDESNYTNEKFIEYRNKHSRKAKSEFKKFKKNYYKKGGGSNV